MAEAARDGELLRLVEADIRFHEFVLSRSGQPHTTQVWRSIAPRIRAYFFRYGLTADLAQIAVEHGQLLQAIQTRDRDDGARGGRAAHHGEDARRRDREPLPARREPAHVVRHGGRRDPRGRRRRPRARDGRHARRRRRVGQRQVRDRALDHGPARRARRGSTPGSRILFEGRELTALSERELEQRPRQRDLDDLPGADDVAQPGLHGRRPDRRGRPAARERRRRRRRSSARARCSSSSASPRPAGA